MAVGDWNSRSLDSVIVHPTNSETSITKTRTACAVVGGVPKSRARQEKDKELRLDFSLVQGRTLQVEKLCSLWVLVSCYHEDGEEVDGDAIFRTAGPT